MLATLTTTPTYDLVPILLLTKESLFIMRKLIFSTLLSTFVISGADATQHDFDVESTAEQGNVSKLTIELPRELQNAV